MFALRLLPLPLLAALALGGCASTTTVDDYRPTSEPIDIITKRIVVLWSASPAR